MDDCDITSLIKVLREEHTALLDRLRKCITREALSGARESSVAEHFTVKFENRAPSGELIDLLESRCKGQNLIAL